MASGFVIHEKEPSGRQSAKAVRNWMDINTKMWTDAKPLWTILVPDIKKSLKYEFSHANPNNWDRISRDYVNWKRSQGYPDTIGIRSGGLKRSLTVSAKIDARKEKLLYKFNPLERGRMNEVVGDYAHWFDKFRPIFGWTKKFIRKSILKKAVDWWLLINRKEGY